VGVRRHPRCSTYHQYACARARRLPSTTRHPQPTIYFDVGPRLAPVHALPFVLGTVCAVALASPLLRALSESGHVKPNYRQREVVFPFGVLSVAAALVALIPLMVLRQLEIASVLYPKGLDIAVYLLGVAFLGLADDMLGGEPRGWRGHGRAVLNMQFSTGALKAVGSLGLALYVTSSPALSIGRWLLESAVLVLATNVFNLLDLRPGRATKVFVLLGAGLTIGAASFSTLWTLGLFVGPALVAGAYDLRECAMLGDTGANLLGALAGLWLVLSLSALGQAIALAILVSVTIYGELRSISSLVERIPLLRQLDSLGRPQGLPR
jgi:UDP-GlcNAc:undecaprenyl-phosphate GlcNAc-1-phosphate transferase